VYPNTLSVLTLISLFAKMLSTYIISLGDRPFHPSVPSSVVIRPVIHPSNFLIPEEGDDGRGGGRRKRQQQIQIFKLKKKKTSY
jgi:hypothetical protein